MIFKNLWESIFAYTPKKEYQFDITRRFRRWQKRR